LNSIKSKENDVVTEILNDNKKILEKGISFMQNVNEKMDICVDSNAPFNIITIPHYHDNYLEIKRRGCKIRFITEITKETCRTARN
jgi:two-component system, OmpR family, sensor histidine kinase VicK